MFDRLIVSRPLAKKAWRRELAGPTFSLVAHWLIVYAAVIATPSSNPGTAAGVSDSILIYEPPPDRTSPEFHAPSLSKSFRTLVAPVTIPNSIPPVDLTEIWDPTRFTGVGTDLGPGPGPAGATDLTRVFVEAVVDEPPRRMVFPPPEYPRMLLDARIEGAVVLEAVIDTLGHPEPASVRVVSSTNAGFDAPAQAAFARALYQPGRVQGQKVRVLVRQPLRFSLPR